MFNQKLFIRGSISIVVGIIVVVVVVVVGIVVWQSGLIGKKTTPMPTPTPTVSPVPSPTLTPAQTAGWKTYRNKEYGFEVKYPKNWYIVQQPTATVVFSSYYYDYELMIENPQPAPDNYCDVGVSVDYGENESEMIDLINKGYIKSTVNIDGVNAIRLTKSHAGITEAVYFNKFRIIKERGFGVQLESECVRIFGQMLSTFRFLK